ncbi:hypothetical protein ACLB2K_002222 [Fragaria x ananassa]
MVHSISVSPTMYLKLFAISASLFYLPLDFKTTLHLKQQGTYEFPTVWPLNISFWLKFGLYWAGLKSVSLRSRGGRLGFGGGRGRGRETELPAGVERGRNWGTRGREHEMEYGDVRESFFEVNDRQKVTERRYEGAEADAASWEHKIICLEECKRFSYVSEFFRYLRSNRVSRRTSLNTGVLLGLSKDQIEDGISKGRYCRLLYKLALWVAKLRVLLRGMVSESNLTPCSVPDTKCIQRIHINIGFRKEQKKKKSDPSKSFTIAKGKAY